MIECNPITSQKGKQTQRVEGTCSWPHTTTILEVRLLGSRSAGPDLTLWWPGDGGAPGAGSEVGIRWKGEPGWGLVGSTYLPSLASALQEGPLSGPS